MKFSEMRHFVMLMLMALLLSLAPAMSFAHSLYIQSSRYKVSEGKRSPLFFCYGHHIPVDDGVRAKKLKAVQVRTPDGEVQNMTIRNETCLHSYMVDYEKPGTYVLSAETNPGYYTVFIDKKGRTRHAIKPKKALEKRAVKFEKSLYSKQFAKTYVVCGEPSKTFPARIGLDLELVPTRDITTLRAGDELELKIYFKGKPFKGQGSWDGTYNGFSTVAEDNFLTRQDISGDTLRVRIPHEGRWYLRYFTKVDAQGTEKENFTQMKYTATLVFEIPNKRKTPKPGSH